MRIQGSCHCRNIGFEYIIEPAPQSLPARACGCGFCTRHGAVWTSTPHGSLVVRVTDDAAVIRYEFGTRTALFHVCARCGVVPLVSCQLDGRVYAVVNVNTLQDIDPAMLDRSASNFEGESVEARLARRARNWIGRVEFRQTGS